MQPGQFVAKWVQDYLAGRLTTPQQIYAASRAEIPLPPTRFFGAPVDNLDLWDVPSRLQAPAHFLSNSWLKQYDRADWAHVDPRLMCWSGHFIKAAEKRAFRSMFTLLCVASRNRTRPMIKAAPRPAIPPRLTTSVKPSTLFTVSSIGICRAKNGASCMSWEAASSTV